MGLGSYPVVPLAQARERSLEARRLAKAKIDPIRERKETSSIMSFEEAAREPYVFHVFGKVPANEVQSQNVLTAPQPIWLAKPETARRGGSSSASARL